MFHTSCYEDMLAAHRRSPRSRESAYLDCPNCRGRGCIIATFTYIEPVGMSTPPRLAAAASNPSDDGCATPGSQAFPWWHADKPPCSYHAGTSLGPGRFGLLVDPGSWGNLQGDRFAKSAASISMQHGKKPTQHKRAKPLNVGGVGHGVQSCEWDCTLPISMRRSDGSYCEATFTAPTIKDSDCPALWGLQSLMEQRAILDCAGKKLHLLGPVGELELTLPPGSETFQLEQSPSGHLLLPASDFARLRQSQERHGTAPTRHLLACDPLAPPPVASGTPTSTPQQAASSSDTRVSPCVPANGSAAEQPAAGVDTGPSSS